MAAETVVVERQGSVLRVRMNRPDKLNAQNPTLITELDAAFAAARADGLRGPAWHPELVLYRGEGDVGIAIALGLPR